MYKKAIGIVISASIVKLYNMDFFKELVTDVTIVLER